MNEMVLVRPEQAVAHKTSLGTYLHPLLIGTCQALSFIVMVGALGTLSTNLALTIPYALFITFSISTVLSFFFSRSAKQSQAMGIIAKSPGGYVLLAMGVVLAIFIAMITPVLTRNGWSQAQAVTVTILAQIPLATVKWINRETLNRIFAEAWYGKAADAVMREQRIKRQLEMLHLIKNAITDAREVTKGSAIERQLVDLQANAQLRIDNSTSLITMVLDRGPKYQDPIYTVLFAAIKQHMEELSAPKKIELPARVGSTSEEIMHELMNTMQNWRS